MRKTLLLAVLLGTAGVAVGQPDPPPPPPEPRYGVPPALNLYPQRNPQEALRSAVLAAERGKAEYLTAHLLDPRFVDARVLDRAAQLTPAAEADLRAARQAQRADPAGVPPGGRLPDDPKGFAEAVAAEARVRAFRLVARDVQTLLADNPDHLRDLRRFARDGQFVDAGETAAATLAGVSDRQVLFRKVGDRWFVQDRQQPEPPPAPPAGK